jgi:hypothetical protein
MLRHLSTEHGRCGTLRRYQHPTLGVLTIVTMWGVDGSADVIHVQHVAQIIRSRNLKRQAKKGGHRREAMRAGGTANGGKGKGARL